MTSCYRYIYDFRILHKINTGDINKQNRQQTKMPYTFVVATDKGIRHI